MEIKPTPVLPVVGQNFPRYFQEYLEFFLQYFELIYLFHHISRFLSFIPGFLTEPLSMLCGTLVVTLVYCMM